MALRPVLRRKVDELFMRWLSDPASQSVLRENLQQLHAGEPLAALLAVPSPKIAVPTPMGHIQPASPRPQTPPHFPQPPGKSASPRSPRKHQGPVAASVGAAGGSGASGGPTAAIKTVKQNRKQNGTPIPNNSSDSHNSTIKRGTNQLNSSAENEVVGRKKRHSIDEKTAPTPSADSTVVPPFYFPLGRPKDTGAIDTEMEKLAKVWDSVAGTEGVTMKQMPEIVKACGLPLYWKQPLFAAGGGSTDGIPAKKDVFLAMWKKVVDSCHDDASKFVWLLSKGQRHSLVHADLYPLIQDILESHPGLAFLISAKDFHSRYVATVVSRVFYCVNASWSGHVTAGELRRSNFLQILASLDHEEDINTVTQFFSYEHFYVIYCKFWELDEDHDLMISKADLAKHNGYAISERMIERIFSGAVTRGKACQEDMMSYPDFVWFLLAEEDKRHPRSIEYWFRCMDLDGDGVLSMYELEFFYAEQLYKMEEMGIEPISFDDCLCQMLDMVKPAEKTKIRLSDLKRCKLCNIFFDTFFNLPKYLEHEQKDPFTNLRDIEEGLNEMSDWDRYAAEAYEILVAEDNNQADEYVYEDDFETDDDNLNLRQSNSQPGTTASIREPLGGRALSDDRVHFLDAMGLDIASGPQQRRRPNASTAAAP